MGIVSDYYSELFQQKHLHSWAMWCREHVWHHILTVVSPRMRELLLAPLTEQELLDTFTEQDGQKCSGKDGLSRAFSLTFWEQIHQPLLASFKHIFSTSKMLESLSTGLICMLPKAGNHQEIR